MPRNLRPLLAGTTYHLTARGNEKQIIARDDGDWEALVALLDDVVRRRRWSVQTYCFMPNHVHLLVRTPEPDLSHGMREVLGDYARRYNDRHERTGHLFQGRFYSGEIASEAHHAEVFRYTALNPVRAGLVRIPEAWRWSAHVPLLGIAPGPAFLDHALRPFGGDRQQYGLLVHDASGSHLRDLIGDGSLERLRLALAAGFSEHQIANEVGVTREVVRWRLRQPPKGV